MSGGVVTLADSGNNFSENRSPATAILTVVATGTSTQNSPDQNNLVQKGANLFLNVSAIIATCTIKLNVQTKDQISGNYLTVYSVSLDAQATAVTSFTQFQFYPGVVSVGTANLFLSNLHLGLIWRAQVSITATASAGTATPGTSLTVAAVPLY